MFHNLGHITEISDLTRSLDGSSNLRYLSCWNNLRWIFEIADLTKILDVTLRCLVLPDYLIDFQNLWSCHDIEPSFDITDLTKFLHGCSQSLLPHRSWMHRRNYLPYQYVRLIFEITDLGWILKISDLIKILERPWRKVIVPKFWIDFPHCLPSSGEKIQSHW